jgi:hypothetical protein
MFKFASTQARWRSESRDRCDGNRVKFRNVLSHMIMHTNCTKCGRIFSEFPAIRVEKLEKMGSDNEADTVTVPSLDLKS